MSSGIVLAHRGIGTMTTPDHSPSSLLNAAISGGDPTLICWEHVSMKSQYTQTHTHTHNDQQGNDDHAHTQGNNGHNHGQNSGGEGGGGEKLIIGQQRLLLLSGCSINGLSPQVITRKCQSLTLPQNTGCLPRAVGAPTNPSPPKFHGHWSKPSPK